MSDAWPVAEKDAFGRAHGEDPLAAMGWDDPGTAVETGPVTTAAPPTHERALDLAPGAVPGAPRRPRILRAVVVTLVAVAFLGGIAALAVPRIVDAVQSIDDELGDQPFLPQGDDAPDATPPAGLQRESLVLGGNLVPALRRLQARSGASRVRLLRIAPDRIDAQVVTAERRMRMVQHRYTGETQVLSDTSSPGVASQATFSWSQIDASAPRRIVRRAVRGKSSRELSYLVLLDAGGLRWSAFLSSGAGFTAGADGRGVRRIGG